MFIGMLSVLKRAQTVDTIPMNDNNSNHQMPSTGVQYLEVSEDDVGQRLDNYLLARLKGVPRTHVYKLIRKDEVRINKKRTSADQRVQAGDLIRVAPVRIAERSAQAPVSDRMGDVLNAAVLYEDDALIVLNKPAGWAVHGGSGVNLGLIEAVRQWQEHAGRWELAHRLDRDTSGCLIIAKKPSILKALQADWENFQKTYLALVDGQWAAKDKFVDAPLQKNVLQSGERVVKVSSEGKASLSEFAIVQQWDKATLVRVKLHTGRTHQIRVHAQWKKHPLLGDDRYASDASKETSKKLGVKRLMLHAMQLIFKHPVSGELLTVEAQLPTDIQKIVSKLSV
jgi:23S rRNA pseudouridine955/2504/2580 synthase